MSIGVHGDGDTFMSPDELHLSDDVEIGSGHKLLTGSPGISDPRKKLVGISKENANLKAQIHELEIKLQLMADKSNTQCKALQSEVNSQIQKNYENLSCVSSTISELESRIAEMDSENASLLHEKRKTDQQVENFLEFITSHYHVKVTNLNEAMAAIIQNETSAEASIQAHDDLVFRLDNTTSLLENAEKENEKLKNKLKKYQKVINEVMKNQDAEEATGDRDDAKLVLKIEELKDQLCEKDQEIADLKEQVQQLSKPPQPIPEPEKDTLIIDSQVQLARRENERLAAENERLVKLVAGMRARIEEISSVNTELIGTLATRDEEIKHLVDYGDQRDKTIKALKQELRGMCDSVDQKDIEIARLCTENSELKIDQTIKKNAAEAQSLQPVVQSPSVCDEMLNMIAQFEGIFRQQSDEIEQLYNQRIELSECIRKMDDVVKSHEGVVEKMSQQIADLETEKDQISAEFKEQIKQAQDDKLNDLDQAMDLLPVQMKSILYDKVEEDSENAFLHVTEALMNELENRDQLVREMEEQNDDLMTKNRGITEGVHGFVRFVKKMGSAVGDDDDNKRTAILAECSRVTHYLEENDLLEEEIDPRTVAEIAIDMIHDEDQSPCKELLALISVQSRMNDLLLDNIQRLQEKQSRVSESPMFITERANLINHINELEKWKDTVAEALNDSNAREEPVDVLCRIKQNYEEQINKLTEENRAKKEELGQLLVKMETDKEDFCQRAEKMVAEIQNQVATNQIDYEKTIAELTNENESVNEELSRTREEAAENAQKLAEIILDKKEKLKTAQSRIEALENAVVQLDAKVSSAHEQIEDYKQELENNKLEMSLLTEKLEKAVTKAKQRKEDLRKVQAEKKEIIDDIRQRNNQLKDKYGSVISRLEQDLAQTRDECQRLSDDNAKISEIRQKLVVDNAKLQVSERALRLKLESVSSALERERSESKNKHLAFQAQQQNVVECKDKIIAMCQHAMESALGYLTSETPADITETAVLLKTSAQEMKKKLEEKLKCPICMKLTSEIRSRDSQIRKLSEEAAHQEEVIKKFREANARLNDATADATAWNKWASGIYNQIAENQPLATAVSQEDLRFVLREAILVALSDRSIRRKLETLRAQKKLLSRFRIQTFRTTDRAKCDSIRPVMIVMLFKHRLERMSGKTILRLSRPQDRPSIVPVHE